jgi:hypothetical protein
MDASGPVIVKRIVEPVLIEPGARLLHRVAVFYAVDGNGHGVAPNSIVKQNIAVNEGAPNEESIPHKATVNTIMRRLAATAAYLDQYATYRPQTSHQAIDRKTGSASDQQRAS